MTSQFIRHKTAYQDDSFFAKRESCCILPSLVSL